MTQGSGQVQECEVDHRSADCYSVSVRIVRQTTQPCEGGVLDDVKVWVLSYPQPVLGKDAMVDPTGA